MTAWWSIFPKSTIIAKCLLIQLQNYMYNQSKSKLKSIKYSYLLSVLDADQQFKLIVNSEDRQLNKNDLVYRENDKDDNIYFIM